MRAAAWRRCSILSLAAARLTIETRAGVLEAEVAGQRPCHRRYGSPLVSVGTKSRCHAPVADTCAIDLTYALPDGRVLAAPSVVNVGNPHCIFWVEDTDSYDFASFGGALEHHPLFPERANISLSQITAPLPSSCGFGSAAPV